MKLGPFTFGAATDEHEDDSNDRERAGGDTDGERQDVADCFPHGLAPFKAARPTLETLGPPGPVIGNRCLVADRRHLFGPI
jgi:hypothetical protein